MPDCLCPLGDSLKKCHAAQPSAEPQPAHPSRAICGRHAVLWTNGPARSARCQRLWPASCRLRDTAAVRRWAGRLCAISVLLAGCSSHAEGPRNSAPSVSVTASGATSRPPARSVVPDQCPTVLRGLISHATGAAAVSLHTQRSSDLLRCTYVAKQLPRGDATARGSATSNCTGATVVIDTASLAFTDFQRWTVETGQNSMWTHDAALNPSPVKGIGIEAEWVPERTTFETASFTAWIAVFLTCPMRHPGARALGAALGRAGLAATDH